jgi:plastocyanin
VPDRKASFKCGVAVAGLLMAGTAASIPGAVSTNRMVVIENLQFNPNNLTVKSGEQIIWVNKDLFPHTVSADAKAFDSGAIAANQSWTWVARKPGIYTYVCTFHPTMKGTVTVQ